MVKWMALSFSSRFIPQIFLGACRWGGPGACAPGSWTWLGGRRIQMIMVSCGLTRCHSHSACKPASERLVTIALFPDDHSPMAATSRECGRRTERV